MKRQFNPTIEGGLFIASLFIAQATMANTFSGRIETKAGYDSNPYRLSDQFSIKGADFLDYQFKAKLKFYDDFSASANISLQDYNSSSNWADNQTISAALRYKTGKFSKRKGISLAYKQKDKTYVSRLKGSTTQHSDQSLDDRYNYQQISANSFINFKLIKRVYNKFDIDITQKDYSDFSQLNITNFDYLGVKLSDTVLIKSNRKTQHSLGLSYESRLFDDRKKKDSQGNEITGTNMVFNYINAEYQYRYKFSKYNHINLEAGYSQRTDNGSGYYNSQKLNSAIASNFRWHKSSNLELNYRYSNFAYLREPEVSQVSNEEDFTSEEKHKISLANNTRLPKKWLNKAHLLLDYSYVIADSNRSQYQYQRQIISAGIKLAF